MQFLKRHQLFRLSLLACVITLSPQVVRAEVVLTLSDAQSEYPLGQYVGVLEEDSGKLTVDDIAGPKYRDQFRSFNEDAPRLGLSRSVFWIRLRLRNESSQNHWLLDQGNANTHYLDLYVPGEDGKTFAVKESGNLRPFTNRDIPHRRIIFKLPIDTDQERTVYLRYQSQAAVILDMMLWSIPAFADADRVDSFWMGVFYGLLGLTLIMTLFLYAFFRNASYLYLFSFVASVTAVYLFYDGYAQMFFSADRAETSECFVLMLLSLSMVALLGFGRQVPSTSMLRKYHQYMHHALVITWLLILVGMPFIGYISTLKATIPLMFITLLYLLVVGVTGWKWQDKPTQFFMLGLFCFILLFLGSMLSDLVMSITKFSWIKEQGRASSFSS